MLTERKDMKTPSKTDWKRLSEMEDKDIDTSDIPELDDAFFQNAALRVPDKKPVAPVLETTLDEVAACLKYTGKPKSFPDMQNAIKKGVKSPKPIPPCARTTWKKP